MKSQEPPLEWQQTADRRVKAPMSKMIPRKELSIPMQANSHDPTRPDLGGRTVQATDAAGTQLLRFDDAAAKSHDTKVNMKCKDTDFPTVDEIRQAVEEHVATQCHGEWPEDSWFSIGTKWSVNVWDELGRKHITVYHDSIGETDVFCGVAIC